MITTLTEIAMKRYVDMVCGDLSVLTSKAEVVGREKLAETRSRLMRDFARIADEAGYNTMLAEGEGKAREAAELQFFRALVLLLELDAVENVRRLLSDYGIAAETMTPERIRREVNACHTRAKANVRRAIDEKDERKKTTPEAARESFDRQAASLMTYFRFQIDMNTISASAFACMIAQADREIKAKLAMYSRK